MSATEVRADAQNQQGNGGSSSGGTTIRMKAVNYQGPFKVKVEEVPKPSIEHPDDVVVKVTTAGEFGSSVDFDVFEFR